MPFSGITGQVKLTRRKKDKRKATEMPECEEDRAEYNTRM